MARFKVVQGGSVIVNMPNGMLHRFTGGQIIPGELLSKKSIEDHLAGGWIKQVGDSEQTEAPQKAVENIPGRPGLPPLIVDPSADPKKATPAAVIVDTGSGIRVESKTLPPTTAPVEKPDGSLNDAVANNVKWGFDPKTLAGKTLNELNVMVHEIDPSVQPFTTVEEAIGQLSLDFKA